MSQENFIDEPTFSLPFPSVVGSVVSNATETIQTLDESIAITSVNR